MLVVLMVGTYRAMNGNVKFEDALAARLDIIKPSKDDIKNCLLAHPPKLTRGTQLRSLWSQRECRGRSI